MSFHDGGNSKTSHLWKQWVIQKKRRWETLKIWVVNSWIILPAFNLLWCVVNQLCNADIGLNRKNANKHLWVDVCVWWQTAQLKSESKGKIPCIWHLIANMSVAGTLTSRVHAAKGSAQLLSLNPSSRRQLPAPLQHKQQRRTVLLRVWNTVVFWYSYQQPL